MFGNDFIGVRGKAILLIITFYHAVANSSFFIDFVELKLLHSSFFSYLCTEETMK